MTEINSFLYKQISRLTQHVESNRKTSSFSFQKWEKRTKIKTVQMNEIRFSVDINTKKSETININDNENQTTIIQICDLLIRMNQTFSISKFITSMSHSEDLFVQQNNSVNADLSKNVKFVKKKNQKIQSKKLFEIFKCALSKLLCEN